jgi:hypothetical protein
MSTPTAEPKLPAAATELDRFATIFDVFFLRTQPMSERQKALTIAGQALIEALHTRRTARVALGRAVAGGADEEAPMHAVDTAQETLDAALESLEAML